MKAYCIICCDLFDEFGIINILPCGHLFHMECISKWLDQSHSCPECRKRYTRANATRIFFNFREEDEGPSSNLLENEISSCKAQLAEKNYLIQSQKDQMEEMRKFCVASEELAADFKNKYLALGTENKCLQLKLKQREREVQRVLKSADELKKTNEELKLLKHIQKAIEGSQKEIDEMMKNYHDSDAVKGLAATCCLLKRETLCLQQSREIYKTKILRLERQVKENCAKIRKQEMENQELVKNLMDAQAENVVLKRMTEGENSSSGANSVELFTPQRPSKRHKEILRSPLPESQTPEVNKILPVPMKKFKVTVPKFEKTMKVPVSKPVNINFLPVRRDDDDDSSIIRSGYNGLGGHSKSVRGFPYR